jgi:DNA modification methylase
MKDEIICGDCRQVLQKIPAESVHLAITSPPYNVGLEYDGTMMGCLPRLFPGSCRGGTVSGVVPVGGLL